MKKKCAIIKSNIQSGKREESKMRKKKEVNNFQRHNTFQKVIILLFFSVFFPILVHLLLIFCESQAKKENT